MLTIVVILKTFFSTVMKALLVVAAVALIRGSFGNYAVLFLSFSITDNILKTFIYVAPL